jgi:hypothetical protein
MKANGLAGAASGFQKQVETAYSRTSGEKAYSTWELL